MTTDAFDARDVFATKADLFATHSELKEDIGLVKADLLATRAELKEEIAALRTEMHTEIGRLRAEIHQMEARLIRWMAGALIGGMVAAATISRLIG